MEDEVTREFIWTTAFLAGWHRCGFQTMIYPG